MTILRAPRTATWTVVPNDLIEDERLSFKALGLLTYILSKPDHWNVSREHLATTHADGESSVRSALRELRAAGYILVETVHAAPGQLAGRRMVVYDTPQTGPSPTGRDPERSETVRSETPQVVTTEVGTTDSETTNTSTTASPPADGTLFEVPTVVDELCTELAEAIERYRGGTGRPSVTVTWHKDMRLLLERGPLGADPEPVGPEKVRGCLAVVFRELHEPEGSGNFCWAAQVQSPAALRRHWWKIRDAAMRRRDVLRGGKLAAVGRQINGGEDMPDLGQVLADHQRNMEARGLPSAAAGYVPAIGASS